MYSTEEITALGMECLAEKLGVWGMEYFIKVIKRERFDYTKWHQNFFGRMDDNKLDEELRQYCLSHEYDGNAEEV